MKKICLKDVARQAGVSPSAVSFAVNGKPGVSYETRRRIFEAMDTLGYVPKKDVEKKKQNKHSSKTVLILNCSRTKITRDVFPDAPYFTQLMRAFDEKLSENGYHFWIRTVNIDEHFPSKIKELFTSEDISCVLLIATDMLEEDVNVVLSFAPKTVVLDASIEGISVNCVVMDNVLGGAQAARYAIANGHTEIGYIQANDRIYNFEMRKLGFLRELGKNGLSVRPDYICSVEPTVSRSAETLQKWFASLPQIPSFLFAENDYIALGALQALKQLGLNVPNDVSVVGFDNIDMAGYSTPALTTIDVSKEKLSEICVSQIKRVMKDPGLVSIKQFIEVKLIERDSVLNYNNK